MKLFTIAALLLTSLASASELKITSFYYLDNESRNDRAAEICFSVKPAPTSPIFANITIDKGTNSEGHYNTFVGPRGRACVVVATWRGTGEVSIPEEEVQAKEVAVNKK